MMCPSLNAPENGVLLSTKEKYHFGDLVRFQCDFGYVMSGSSSLLCTSTGVWNGTVPECKCKEIIVIFLIEFLQVIIFQMPNASRYPTTKTKVSRSSETTRTVSWYLSERT